MAVDFSFTQKVAFFSTIVQLNINRQFKNSPEPYGCMPQLFVIFVLPFIQFEVILLLMLSSRVNYENMENREGAAWCGR